VAQAAAPATGEIQSADLAAAPAPKSAKPAAQEGKVKSKGCCGFC